MLLRILISVSAWVLSWAPLTATVTGTGAAIKALVEGTSGSVFLFAWPILAIYAWIALLMMTISWIRGRRVPSWVPISGTVAGMAASLPFIFAIVFAAPGIIFAIFLCHYHFLSTSNEPLATSFEQRQNR